MAKYCCSIELEPRTLKPGQLDHVREIAVDIVQKKEPDEASSIFNELQFQGLKDMIGMKEPAPGVAVSVESRPQKAEEGGRTVLLKEENCCQCLVVESSPESVEIKEPLSAPF